MKKVERDVPKRLHDLETNVAEEFSILKSELVDMKDQNRCVTRARHALWLRAHQHLNLTPSMIARIYGTSRNHVFISINKVKSLMINKNVGNTVYVNSWVCEGRDRVLVRDGWYPTEVTADIIHKQNDTGGRVKSFKTKRYELPPGVALRVYQDESGNQQVYKEGFDPLEEDSSAEEFVVSVVITTIE